MTEQNTAPPSRPQANDAKPKNTRDGLYESTVYLPSNLEAMVGVRDSFLFTDVEWKRSLGRRIEDAHHYGLAIVPYEELYSLATEKAYPRAWPYHELQRYLRVVLRIGDPYSKHVTEFSNYFCLALQECCTHLQQQQSRRGEGDRRIWVYESGQRELSGIRRLPSSITEPVKTLLEMLREYPRPGRSGTLNEDARSWLASRVNLRQSEDITEGVADAGQTVSLSALTRAWTGEGYHEHLLRKYIWYKMIKQAPSRQYEINALVGQLFDKPWETRHRILTADENNESDLRIHHTREPDGGRPG
ncbi:hypothetical protein PtrSN002B_011234 [Pyrenophora tritici-repentis]|uniref:Uncharacterized protein n=1 Tax=Pyrenophora tritici-repentis (strain Pt-1C-BFP) TaxID=426418 RepID=B2W8B1_PYRTR|nr:uncharacterized protein PTRG_06219 [Pyrenophora tritici-repentis Pt-1C-BFP]KAI1523933.1 hypothetical protein PtrSN001A_011092 [Pyrenophora tritici-repentis]EDU49139.1 predicted protein [Pyrenophora tritici-repentis Pt-1C-BFP]KAI1529018.1 hypothetical protein PtrSN002B_011234 [Pyrenophora tritici-repentis]KAI1575232.1 hypothetical protein PtrEW13061_010863 [Pyrenophora tritici-repentis]PWO20365.1 c-x8-c-x5-c-x3-h type zinc finger protein [Pyrenophora tritici-repentis]